MMQAVLFDMDGLLIDSGPIWKDAYRDTLSQRGLSFGDAEYLQTAGMRLVEAVNYWSSTGLYPSADCQAVMDEIHSYVLAHLATCPYMDGAEELLFHIQETSLPIGLVSASERYVVDYVIEQKNWNGVFDVIVTGTDVHIPKPDPEAYIHTAAELSIPIGNCLVFEDSVPGVRAGVASGARTIAIPKRGMETATIMDAAWRRYRSLAEITPRIFYSLIHD